MIPANNAPTTCGNLILLDINPNNFVENKINDSISPQPNYILELQNNDQTIKLTVRPGEQKPY